MCRERFIFAIYTLIRRRNQFYFAIMKKKREQKLKIEDRFTSLINISYLLSI